MYQFWWRICQEIDVFSRFEHHMFYILYPFMSYLLTLPCICAFYVASEIFLCVADLRTPTDANSNITVLTTANSLPILLSCLLQTTYHLVGLDFFSMGGTLHSNCTLVYSFFLLLS
jgi:hypothetical protein